MSDTTLDLLRDYNSRQSTQETHLPVRSLNADTSILNVALLGTQTVEAGAGLDVVDNATAADIAVSSAKGSSSPQSGQGGAFIWGVGHRSEGVPLRGTSLSPRGKGTLAPGMDWKISDQGGIVHEVLEVAGGTAVASPAAVTIPASAYSQSPDVRGVSSLEPEEADFDEEDRLDRDTALINHFKAVRLGLPEQVQPTTSAPIRSFGQKWQFADASSSGPSASPSGVQSTGRGPRSMTYCHGGFREEVHVIEG